jgi:hypothetical protein
VGLTVGDGVSQLFLYPARARSSGEFTQAVIHVTGVRAAVEEMRGRGVAFEEYDTPETRTENGLARMPGGGEAAWFKDSEGNRSALSQPEENQPRQRTTEARRTPCAWFRPVPSAHTLRTSGSARGEP